MKRGKSYDQKYREPGYYWGKKPSGTAIRLVEVMGETAGQGRRLIDLGCGEGRNAVYFAQHGFDVAGLDVSPTGLRKTRELADEAGAAVETIEADILHWRPRPDSFDVLFSTGTLHYLPPGMRESAFQGYKEGTRAGGYHAVSVFVEKPFVDRAPDAEEASYLWRSGTLLGFYWDWEVLYSIEEIFDCNSGGVPHRHAVNRVIARKPAAGS